MAKHTEPIRSSRALMAQRREPPLSLDNFPTPPWATRALCELVLPRLGVDASALTVWEPACGEGIMAAVLREYFKSVFSTDIYNYLLNKPCEGLCYDFLNDEAQMRRERNGGKIYDWVITNPPFSGKQKCAEARIDRSLEFILLALKRARLGVAMFVRTQWAVEGVTRYERLFKLRPPTVFAPFAERVPLCRGRWNPDGSTATAYCWLVWVKGKRSLPTFFIPPGQRKALTEPDDRRRFAAWSMPVLAEAAE